MISLIVAVAKNGVIGVNNTLPWKLSSDLRRFKELTTGHKVLMGRKTYDSIVAVLGKPLPNRENIIITRQPDFQAPGCTVVLSWEAAKKFATDEELFVLGGEEIFRLALPDADKIYLTTVDTECTGDAYFPPFDKNEWEASKVIHIPAGEKDQYPSTFEILMRKKNFVYLGHARGDEQRELMERIAEDGVCPFCAEHFRKYHPRPILEETNHWFATENVEPYKGTSLHLLFVLKRHITLLEELKQDELLDLWGVVTRMKERFPQPGNVLIMRNGKPSFTGGSVDHFHAHLISGSRDREYPGAEKIKVKIGYK